MNFAAWFIERDAVVLDTISPAGPLHVETWTFVDHNVPERGSAIVLPVEPTLVRIDGRHAEIGRGWFAQVPGGSHLSYGRGVIIHTPEYRGLMQIGGPLEATGRLKYIDGCSDTLLICPPVVGEPCLNHLHLPAGTQQTAHTHPSDRLGIILRGAGVCRTPSGDTELLPGMFWYIPTGSVHSFHTIDQSLDVIAWHPDSDFGPTHDAHPMINRTLVEGVAANDPRHAAIRTT